MKPRMNLTWPGTNALSGILSCLVAVTALLAVGCGHKGTDPVMRLDVAPSSVQFSVQQDIAVRSDQVASLDITCTGSWRAEADAEWLIVRPTSGTGNGKIAVSVGNPDMPPGFHKGTITVTCPGAENSPKFVDVLCEVSAPGPRLVLSATSLEFAIDSDGQLPTEQAVDIANDGSGELNWEIRKDVVSSWLTVSPLSGMNNVTVKVRPSTTKLPAGNYECWLRIADREAGTLLDSISVRYSIKANDPHVSASPTEVWIVGVRHGGLPAAGSALSICNDGGGVLIWQAKDDAEWLDLSATSGSNPSGICANVVPSVSTTNLTIGIHTATVTISSSNGGGNSQQVLVRYKILGPRITTNVQNLYFQALQGKTAPASQMFRITNTGQGTLEWETEHTASWLSVSPAAGVETGDVLVSVNRTDLTPGTFTDTIWVRSAATDDADNSPYPVAVFYQVRGPQMNVDPTTLRFEATRGQALPQPKTFTVTNVGGGILNWTSAADVLWLKCTPDRGTENTSVLVQPLTTDLPVGTYQGKISLGSNAAEGAQTLVVEYVIAAPPSIRVSPEAINFAAIEDGTLPLPKTVTLSNNGGGTLNWSVTGWPSWLTVSPTSGLSNTTVITLTPNTTHLPPGEVCGSVVLSSANADNSPKSISVCYSIAERQPHIVIDPAALSFSAHPGDPLPLPESITISNSGGGTLSWWIEIVNGSWLDVTPTGAGDGGIVSARPKTTMMEPGTYRATVKVWSSNADNSPQSVEVTYVILSL